MIYTLSNKKTCHFVFDYNSGFSLSMFILYTKKYRSYNQKQNGMFLWLTVYMYTIIKAS